MARRKTAYNPPSERSVLEETPRVTAYGYEIRCRMLTFEDDVLGVGLKFSENHKTGEMTIDFASAFLPPNRLNPQVTQFKDRPDIARVVVAVIDTYMLRQQVNRPGFCGGCLV